MVLSLGLNNVRRGEHSPLAELELQDCGGRVDRHGNDFAGPPHFDLAHAKCSGGQGEKDERGEKRQAETS